MVVGENPEDQLAPYQENNMGDCPQEYLEFDVEVEAAEIATRAQELRDEKKEDGSPKFPRYAEISDEEVLKDYYGGEKNEDGDWGYWSNPNSRWDWYQIGGRWAGMLKLKEGATGEKGEQSWMQRMSGTPYPEGRADQAYKGDIDVEGMRAEAVKEAEERWAKYEAVVKEHGPLPSDEWTKLPGGEDRDKAKAEYWDHPTVKGVKEMLGLFGFPSDEFKGSKEEYIEKAKFNALGTYALLMDGEWVAQGEMGWFGMSSDTEESRSDFYKKLNEAFDALPDDTLITIVDCHV